MVEEHHIVKVFDIDPTPAPSYTPLSTYVTSPHVTDVRYGGWTDNAYMFVLPRGHAMAKFDINYTTLEELDGVLYDIHTVMSTSHEGLPEGVPRVTSEDVRVVVWNCRGTARAPFRPNLFTLMSMTSSLVVVLTDTHAAGRNARRLLNKANDTEYFYSEPLGFVGGVSVIWDSSKVAMARLTGENDFVSFCLKIPPHNVLPGNFVAIRMVKWWQ
ncbi:hypothetical protein Cgig2_007114 [Carnegiea gigantea]|uniref:Uncharacterized protein n=1 Tax=Carnegiea gigantea TaxID=171969 RepID=A0A9Q1JYF2_9CARY|nr:hypothetical protein Cgig2_007114 [Carnegiea gigantea]